MGNPAGERRKKSEKRRAKFEKRLGGMLAYVSKTEREEVLRKLAGEAAAAGKKA